MRQRSFCMACCGRVSSLCAHATASAAETCKPGAWQLCGGKPSCRQCVSASIGRQVQRLHAVIFRDIAVTGSVSPTHAHRISPACKVTAASSRLDTSSTSTSTDSAHPQHSLHLCCYTFGEMTPASTMYGTSAASQGARPRHSACAKPKCGLHGAK